MKIILKAHHEVKVTRGLDHITGYDLFKIESDDFTPVIYRRIPIEDIRFECEAYSWYSDCPEDYEINKIINKNLEKEIFV